MRGINLQDIFSSAWNEPIYRSSLDTDFYKFLMDQLFWSNPVWRDLIVTFEVTIRTPWIKIGDATKDDEGDSSLDFLPRHDHYRTFAKLTQDARFNKCKEMLLEQYDEKQKEKLEKKKREVFFNIKNS